MPLSEEELRMLEQMERALVAEDPKFASTLRGTSARTLARRQAFLAAGAFVVGMVVLLAGPIFGAPLVGAAGFLIMVGAAYAGLSAWQRQHRIPASDEVAGAPLGAEQAFGLDLIEGGRSRRRPARSSRTRSSRPAESFMERLEERWRRRRENGGL